MKAGLPPIVSGNPRQLDSGNDYDRMQRYARISTGLNALLAVVCCVQAAFLFSLFPLKQVVPQFITFSDSKERVVTIDPRRVNRETRDILTEKLLRQYVLDREAINTVDDTVRYQRVELLTKEQLYQAFKQKMAITNPESPLRDYQNNGMTRTPYIESVSQTSIKENIWTVDFMVIDRKDGREIARRSVRANIAINFPKTEIKDEWATENPIGLQVISYETVFRDVTATKKDEKQ